MGLMFWYLVLENKDWKLIPWRAYDVPCGVALFLISHTSISVVSVEDRTFFTPYSLDFITLHHIAPCSVMHLSLPRNEKIQIMRSRQPHSTLQCQTLDWNEAKPTVPKPTTMP